MKKVIISVTSDLTTDQRVNKTASTLTSLGFHVTLVGRKKKDSLALETRLYKMKRFYMLFEKGPCFYAEYNIRLFFYLLFHKVYLLVSNDLDTLLPNYLVHKFKNIPVVYDSHEYFTGVPELENRRFVRNIWKRIEKFIFPKLKDVFTVNQSIAELYNKEYGVDVRVVRNISSKKEAVIVKTKDELGIPTDKKIILLQGAGINVDRGAEEAVESMQYLENTVLLIIGSGDVINKLKDITVKLNLNDKIRFIPKQLPDKLMEYTVHADIGLTLDKDTNINYRYSLPNKLFDYIQAGVPVLASNLVEIKKIITHYNIGEVIDNHNPRHIADKINSMLGDNEKLELWKNNVKFAADELNWENEQKKLADVFEKYK